MLAAFFKGLALALLEGLRAVISERARDAAMREAGAAEQKARDERAAGDAAREMGVIADEQARNNAVDRGGAAGVLERLRRAGH